MTNTGMCSGKKKISNGAWDGKSQSVMSQDIFVGECMAHTKVTRNAVPVLKEAGNQ